MFDVVILTDRNNTNLNQKLNANLKSYEIDFDHRVLLKNNIVNFPEMLKHENRLHDLIINMDGDSKMFNDLSSMNFDAGFSLLLPYEVLLLKSLQIPVLEWGLYFADPLTMTLN